MWDVDILAWGNLVALIDVDNGHWGRLSLPDVESNSRPNYKLTPKVGPSLVDCNHGPSFIFCSMKQTQFKNQGTMSF